MIRNTKSIASRFLVGIFVLGLCNPGFAQDDPFALDDDPFAPAATDDPFGAVATDDPFALPPGPSAAPSANPFDLPTSGDPFAVDESPFAPTLSPFGTTPAPPAARPTAARPPAPTSRMLGPGRLEPRMEVTIDDPAVRRAVEIRGLYVGAVGRGMQSTTQVQTLASDIKAGDFNRVYVEVRGTAGTAYRSELEPSLPYVSVAYPNPVRDLRAALGDLITVVGVVDVLPAHNAAVGSRPAANNTVSRFPDFAMVDPHGNLIAPNNLIYLDPGDPNVRQYLAAVFEEIATTTAVDAFLLKGLHYPSEQFGYSPGAVQAFRGLVGGSGPPRPDDPIWGAWRRNQLTETVIAIREAVARVNPAIRVGVLVPVDGPAPVAWEDYTNSLTYNQYMLDWITWCRIEAIDEIVFEIHERVQPQGNVLRGWVQFINSNVGFVRPAVSLSGRHNTRQGLTSQFTFTRERSVGTILHEYSDPARDFSRGFFASMRDTLLRGAPGRPVVGRQLAWQPEERAFRRMASPPPELVIATPTPAIAANPLAGRDLVFATPTPIPTPLPPEAQVPAAVQRRLTLRNGRVMEVVVLEVMGNMLTISPTDGPTVQIPTVAVASIEPPL